MSIPCARRGWLMAVALLVAALLLIGCSGAEETQEDNGATVAATAEGAAANPGASDEEPASPTQRAVEPVATAEVSVTVVAVPATTGVTSQPTAAPATPQATPEPPPQPTQPPVPTEPAVPSDGRAWSAYLALGDSVVTATDLASPTTQGYPALLASHLEADAVGGAVELLNLARNGETTASMLRGGQLDAAVQQLQARNGNADQSDDIGVITLHIGGNDAFALIQECSNGLTLACLAVIPTRVETLIANLDAIVGQLRSAAGPDATLILGTYYNPLVHPGCMLHELAGLAETLFEGAPPVMPSGLNDVIRAAAAKHEGRVAEASGLSASELLPDCMHPAADGHRVIADAFIAAYAYG